MTADSVFISACFFFVMSVVTALITVDMEGVSANGSGAGWKMTV